MRFHVLETHTSAHVLAYDMGYGFDTHINLFRSPSVHGQGLDLGDMRAQLSVQCGATHAKEDTHLSKTSACSREQPVLVSYIPASPSYQKLVCDSSMDSGGQTWGRGIAIGTSVVTRNGPDQFRKGLFIPRLLALAEARRHNACTIYNYKNIEKEREKGVAINPHKMRE